MANTNTLSNAVVPQIVAQGLKALREQAITPRLVNRAYDENAGELGTTIEVNVASAITAASVTPSYVPPDDDGVSPTKVQITLDQWYEAPFFLNDKELNEVEAGYMPLQAGEAVKSLANNVDVAILGLYPGVYGWAGVSGTTPFSTDLSEYTAARKALNKQLAPMDPRFCLIDEDAEENAINLRAFQDASYRGDTEGIINGHIGRKLGADWYLNQNIVTHTAGDAAGATGSGTAGEKTVTLQSAGTGEILAGDIITFAGDTQTYAVVTGDSDVSDGGTLTLKNALASSPSSAAITVKEDHVVNLVAHRDAFAFVNRPFLNSDPLGLGTFAVAVDEISGLTLRVEVSRQHRRTRWAFDILYGIKLVREQFAARMAG